MSVLEYLLDGLTAELELERELGVRSIEVTPWVTPASDAVRTPRLPDNRGRGVPSASKGTDHSTSDAVRTPRLPDNRGRGVPSASKGTDHSTPDAVRTPRPRGEAKVSISDAVRTPRLPDNCGRGVPSASKGTDHSTPDAVRTPRPREEAKVSISDAVRTPRPREEAKVSYDFVFIHDRPLSPGGVEMMAKIIAAMGKTAETAPVIVAPPIPQARIYVFLGRAALNRYMPEVRAQEGVWFKSPKGKEIMLVKSPEEILRFKVISPAVQKMKRDMWQSLKVVMQRARQGV